MTWNYIWEYRVGEILFLYLQLQWRIPTMWWSTRLLNMMDAYIYVSLPFRKRFNHSYSASFPLKISCFIHEPLKNQTFISQTIRQSIPPSPYRPLWALSTSSITNKYVLFLETITSQIGCDEMGIFHKNGVFTAVFWQSITDFSWWNIWNNKAS